MEGYPNGKDGTIRLVPTLDRWCNGGLVWYTDPVLAEEGVVVAFTERTGGVSTPPYDGLNLAAHVGDDPHAVDANRTALLDALGLVSARSRLTCAEQVHGARIAEVREPDAGSGAFASGGRPPVHGVDGLLTSLADTPLMLLFADCVPVVLVAPPPAPAVAVVHAGWRGAAAGILPEAVSALAASAARSASGILAYVGPSIGGCCYEVGRELVSRFGPRFATIRATATHLDLEEFVADGLSEAGIPRESVCRMRVCTVDHVGSFYSYRASGGLTGRHAAVGAIRVK